MKCQKAHIYLSHIYIHETYDKTFEQYYGIKTFSILLSVNLGIAIVRLFLFNLHSGVSVSLVSSFCPTDISSLRIFSKNRNEPYSIMDAVILN